MSQTTKPSKKRIYLAGPMRNYPDFNFPMFDKAKAAFGASDWEVISPADMDRDIGFDGSTGDGVDPEFVIGAMRRDLTVILTCDAICLLPGWENSQGAQCEYSVASALGLEILQYMPGGRGFSPYITPTAMDSLKEQRAKALKELSTLTQEQAHTKSIIDPDVERYNERYRKLGGTRSAIETRITSATGGQKNQKQAQLGALDPNALMMVAEVAGFGSQKYARYNFLKGYDWSLSYDAMQRHLHTFWSGTDNDDESTLPHLAHAAWHCLALLAFSQRKVGTDDRPV